HVQMNDRPGFGLEMRHLRLQVEALPRTGFVGVQVLPQQRRQRRAIDAAGDMAEETAAREAVRSSAFRRLGDGRGALLIRSHLCILNRRADCARILSLPLGEGRGEGGLSLNSQLRSFVPPLARYLTFPPFSAANRERSDRPPVPEFTDRPAAFK